MANINILVKVGNSTDLSFTNCDVYRAITVNDLIKLSDRCNIVVIENLCEDEVDEARNFIQSFTSNSDNLVVFYVPDTEELITTGLADELDLKICITARELFEHIYESKGLNVSADLQLRKEINAKNVEVSPFDVDFGSEFSNIDNIDTEENKTTKEEDKTTNSSKVSLVKEEEKIENIESDNLGKEETVVDNSNNNENNEIDLNKDSINFDNLTEDSLGLADRLKSEIDKTYKLAQTLKDANNRIDELLELNRALKQQYSDSIEAYNKLLETDEVIEDPISLQVYKDIEEKLRSSESTVEELNRTVDRLKEEIERHKSNIILLESNISDKNKELEASRSELDALNTQIKNGEIVSEELETMREQCKQAQKSIAELQDSVDAKDSEIERLQDKLDSKKESLEIESASRQVTLDFINSSIEELENMTLQLDKVKEENSRHLEVIESLKRSGNDSDNVISSQANEIITLRNELGYKDQEIANAMAEENHLKNEHTRQIAELNGIIRAKDDLYNALSEELKRKEMLMIAAGVDESGANALIAKTKNLEEMNEVLREGLASANSEKEKYKHEAERLKETLTSSQKKNEQLRDTITKTKSDGNLRFPGTLNYQGNGTIISFFGSGSFGVTTSAMSLAHYLSYNNKKVVYVDFDLVNPKADTWFGLSPSCTELVGELGQNNTALAALFERGMDYFANKASLLIKNSGRSKNASFNVDYIGGVYYRVDSVRMLSCELTRFFNFLGSNYDYVIVDLGRLGSSELNDSLIRYISGASYRNIVVSSCEPMDIRNFRLKIDMNTISMDRIMWILNMGLNTAVDDRVKKFLAPPDRMATLLLEPRSFGSKRTFLQMGGTNSDKFKGFVNHGLLNRK